MDLLISWGRKHGAVISEHLQFENGTAFAKEAIPPSTTLLTCPYELAITPKVAKSFFPDSWSAAVPTHTALCMFLTAQRHDPQSKWAPYINVLPTTFDTPAYFDEDDLKYLTATNLFASWKERIDVWQDEWRTAVNLLPTEYDKEAFTWDDYLWSATVLSSRSFPSRLLDDGPSDSSPEASDPVLFPIVDSLNHKPRTPVTWLKEAGQCLKLIAEDEHCAGEEVCNNYGPKGNEELLMGYGFCIEPNDFDSVALRMGLPPNVSPPKLDLLRKAGLLDEVGGRTRFKVQYLTHEDPFPEDLQKQFRVLTATDMEVAAMPDDLSGTLRNECDMIYQAGVAIYMKLTQICVARGNLPLPQNSRQEWAMVYQRGQVRVLAKALDAAASNLKELVTPLNKVQWENLDHDKSDSADIINEAGLTSDQLLGIPTECDETLHMSAAFRDLVEGIFGSGDPDMIRENDEEILFLVLFLVHERYKQGKRSYWAEWLEKMAVKHDESPNRHDNDNGEEHGRKRVKLECPGITYEVFQEFFEEFFDVISDRPEEDYWTTGRLEWALAVVCEESVVINWRQTPKTVLIVEPARPPRE
ncbi:hypothetical protein YB2330_001580 [Saitoella coloradoensis]